MSDMALFPSAGCGRGKSKHSATLPLDDELLDLGDRLRGIEPLRAGPRAVHDRVAAVELERVLEVVEARTGILVAAVDDPAIGLQQDRRAQVAFAVPPVARAAGRAARAQDAFVQAPATACGSTA